MSGVCMLIPVFCEGEHAGMLVARHRTQSAWEATPHAPVVSRGCSFLSEVICSLLLCGNRAIGHYGVRYYGFEYTSRFRNKWITLSNAFTCFVSAFLLYKKLLKHPCQKICSRLN